MEKVRLGRTGLMVTKTSFGALPVQRRTLEDGAKLLRKAYDAGINFFDTARAYSDSEQKINMGLSDVREVYYHRHQNAGENRRAAGKRFRNRS